MNKSSTHDSTFNLDGQLPSHDPRSVKFFCTRQVDGYLISFCQNLCLSMNRPHSVTAS
ncbi:hypothetical protein BDZ97DRAFT_1827789 [Flammula alnicola]|nr:hypothetical protein BDZ97DRAFT_1827789 [Flammula alnicola]